MMSHEYTYPKVTPVAKGGANKPKPTPGTSTKN